MMTSKKQQRKLKRTKFCLFEHRRGRDCQCPALVKGVDIPSPLCYSDTLAPTPPLTIMQTFLTFPDSFKRTASTLDNKRLGKQRVEAKQILLTNQKYQAYQEQYTPLSVPSNLAWRNHPAVKMWRGYDGMLALYGRAICVEWKARGFQDSLLPFFESILISRPLDYPHWLSTPAIIEKVVASHRASLLSKDFAHYSQYWPDIPPKYGYYWPT